MISEILICGIFVAPPPPTALPGYGQICQVASDSARSRPQTLANLFYQQDQAATTLPEATVGRVSSIILEPRDQARARSIERIRDRIVAFKYDLADNPGDLTPLEIGQIIDTTIEMIDSLPANIDVPNAMILNDAISLYWDLGGVYAEIALGINGNVSLYAKHPTRDEVLVDTTTDELRGTGAIFPPEIGNILA